MSTTRGVRRVRKYASWTLIIQVLFWAYCVVLCDYWIFDGLLVHLTPLSLIILYWRTAKGHNMQLWNLDILNFSITIIYYWLACLLAAPGVKHKVFCTRSSTILEYGMYILTKSVFSCSWFLGWIYCGVLPFFNFKLHSIIGHSFAEIKWCFPGRFIIKKWNII